MHGALLAAAISPDNTPHGYNLTFAFPMLMFIIIAGALYLRLRYSRRVPGQVALASTRWAASAGQPAATAESTTSGSTLLEGRTALDESTVQESPAQEGLAPESTAPEGPAQEGTEDTE
jgi:hypothetical protein